MGILRSKADRLVIFVMKMLGLACILALDLSPLASLSQGVDTYFDFNKELVAISSEIQSVGIYELKSKAVKGDASAQASLGYAYYFGNMEVQDYDESFKWFSRSALAGNIVATDYLSGMLDMGLGCSIDHEKAFWHLIKCADAGHIDSQIRVAERYENGEFNTPSNISEAIRYAEKAAKLNSVRGMKLLADILCTTGNAKAGMEWLEKAAWYNSNARSKVGASYFNGIIVARNFQKAYFWLKVLEKFDGIVFPKETSMAGMEISDTDKELVERQVEEWIIKQKVMAKEKVR